MEIKVHGWRYEGIRGGLAKATVDLGNAPSRWTLIQMPNGTGKTTTMALLRAAFSHETFTPVQVKGFRQDDATKTGLFELSLSVDEKLFRIQLRFDFEAGTCTYWTARSGLSGGGLEEGWLLPSDLKRLFTQEFVRLFVFDGELAKEIRTVGRDRAASAIKTLYKIDLLAQLEQRVSTLVTQEQERASAVSTATEQRGVTRWKRAVAQCKQRASQLSSEIASLQNERRDALAREAELNAKVANRMSAHASLSERAETLKSERESIEKQVLDDAVQALSTFRAPPKLAGRVLDRLHALGAKLTHLKLPKTISSEFFQELAVQERCVCGRPITAAESKVIADRAPLYLADDQIVVINKMKVAVRECKVDDLAFSQTAETLKATLRRRLENSRALDQVQLDLVEAGDVEVGAWRAELQQLANKLPSLDEKLERASTREPTRQRALGCNDENNLPMCEAELERSEKKLATATNTRNFTYQAGVTRRLLSQLITYSLDGLRVSTFGRRPIRSWQCSHRVRRCKSRKLEALSNWRLPAWPKRRG